MRLPSPQTTTRTALRYGVPAGLLASVLLTPVLLAVGGGPLVPTDDLAGTLIAVVFFLVSYGLGPVVVFGVPVALYLRFGLVSPAPVFVGVSVALLAVGGGLSVSLLFVLFQDVPAVVVYAVVGTLEWYVRDRRGTLPSESDATTTG
ncbi:hypothetical protein [Halobaculum sp. MBLA0143]|uniref:hypothetical protein n=1 Tax=Halobaculum sp. MBLA0143 TaxID=3079933 RepID=UPI0035234503